MTSSSSCRELESLGRGLVTIQIQSLPEYEQCSDNCSKLHNNAGSAILPEFQFASPCLAALEYATNGQNNNSNNSNTNITNIKTTSNKITHDNNSDNDDSVIRKKISEIKCPFANYSFAFCMAVIARPHVSLLSMCKRSIVREVKRVIDELNIPYLSDTDIQEEEATIHACCGILGCKMIIVEDLSDAGDNNQSLCVFGDDELNMAAVIYATRVVRKRSSYYKYSLCLLDDDRVMLPFEDAISRLKSLCV